MPAGPGPVGATSTVASATCAKDTGRKTVPSHLFPRVDLRRHLGTPKTCALLHGAPRWHPRGQGAAQRASRALLGGNPGDVGFAPSRPHVPMARCPGGTD